MLPHLHQNFVEDTKIATKANATVPKEYVVSGLVCLVETLEGKKYVARWYQYGEKMTPFSVQGIPYVLYKDIGIN